MQRPLVVPADLDRREALGTVHLIRAVAFAYQRQVADAAVRAKIPATDLRALVVLLDAERATTPVYAGDLARSLGMSTQATTALLRRLEEAGHVERRRDPRDRRHVQIVVTDKALELGWRHFGPIVERLLDAVGQLGTDERALVDAALRRARDTLEAADVS